MSSGKRLVPRKGLPVLLSFQHNPMEGAQPHGTTVDPRRRFERVEFALAKRVYAILFRESAISENSRSLVEGIAR